MAPAVNVNFATEFDSEAIVARIAFVDETMAGPNCHRKQQRHNSDCSKQESN